MTKWSTFKRGTTPAGLTATTQNGRVVALIVSTAFYTFHWNKPQEHYDVHFLQKYVPRRPRSRWSQINIAKVDELITAGRMRPSGLAEVEAAKADGRWAAAYGSRSAGR